jgi:hypothetical protein
MKFFAIAFFVFSFLHTKASDSIPNYANILYWASHPLKQDAADKIPKPLQKNYQLDTTVDVFFIHPTTYTSSEKSFGQNAVVDNKELNEKTENGSIQFQASVFNNVGNIYAPFYKQAHISSYFLLKTEDSLKAISSFEIAYQDVKVAFEYYLTHWNKNKPIIIASHSQGTTHAKRLVKEFFDGTSLQPKLIAAYLVGMQVEENWFQNISPCNTPLQTGCITSWRTFREGFIPDYIQEEKIKAVVTNPLTWSIENTSVDRKQNNGSVLRNFNKIVKHVASATIHENVLWTTKPRFFLSFLLKTKNYHIADFNFYYLSIRENAKLRANTWKEINLK